MTKEQWETFEKELSGMYGSVTMKIDGYDVKFQIRCYSQKGMSRRDCIMVFIKTEENVFQWKWEWCSTDNPIRTKFCNKKESFLLKKKERDELEKLYKRAKRMAWTDMVQRIGNYKKKFVQYVPTWFSTRSLKNHLIKNCESIEIINQEVPA